MLEDGVDVALAGNVPDRLSELARLGHVDRVFGRVDLRQLAPAVEVLAVDHALGAERHHIIALRLVRDDADRVGAGRGAELHAEHAQTARGAPDQHVVAGLQAVRLVTEQHAIGRREGERVGGAFFPGQVLGARHQLAVLHAAELAKRAVRRLVAPDALRGREHRVAAVTFLVVAVVLIAMDDDLVSDLPALHFGADRPDDARGVGTCDMIGVLVNVERRDGLAESGPDAVVVNACRHHEHEHVVAVESPCGDDFHLHRLLRRTVPVLADRPGIHVRRHMAERGNLADFVKVFLFCDGR